MQELAAEAGYRAHVMASLTCPAALLSLRCHAAATLNFRPEPLSSGTEQGVGTLRSVCGVGKRRDGGRGNWVLRPTGETAVEKGELR